MPRRMATHNAGGYLAERVFSRTFQLVAHAPSGAQRPQPLVRAPEAHALQHLRRRTGPASRLPDQRATDARTRGLRDPHADTAHVPDRSAHLRIAQQLLHLREVPTRPPSPGARGGSARRAPVGACRA
eukprot:2429796-Alexandrium_andersonii.AAC.1